MNEKLINKIDNEFLIFCGIKTCKECKYKDTKSFRACHIAFTLEYIKENAQQSEYKNKYKEALKNMTKKELCEFKKLMED